MPVNEQSDKAMNITLFFRIHLTVLLLGLLTPCCAQELSKQSRRYVILSDSLDSFHRVQVQRVGNQLEGLLVSDPKIESKTLGVIKSPTISVEIFNLLIPATGIKSFVTKPNNLKNKSSFLIGDTLLITMALLPHATEEARWLPIQIDTIQVGHLITLSDVIQSGYEQINAYRQAGNPGMRTLLCQNNLIPLMYYKKQYWISNSYVLTEYFQIRQYYTKEILLTDLATINIKSVLCPKEILLQNKRERSRNPHEQLESIASGNVLQRCEKKYYEFWSNPNIIFSHPNILQYGSGDFYYRPGIGIVSSSYKYYFQNITDKYIYHLLDKPFDIVSIDGKLINYSGFANH